jgi:hypothetical protein
MHYPLRNISIKTKRIYKGCSEHTDSTVAFISSILSTFVPLFDLHFKMQFLELQAVVLAYLATSVSGLTIAGDHLIKPRDSSVGTDGEKCYPNPSQWQTFQDNDSSGDPQTTCYDEYPGSGHGTNIVSLLETVFCPIHN